MKQLNLNLLLAVSAMTLFSSCIKDIFCIEGKGDTISVELEMESFSGIALEEAAEVYISQGETQSVIVTGKENIIDRLETDIHGGVWDIDLGRECFDDLDLRIDIIIPEIDEIHLSSSGNITVHEFQDQSNIDLSISGSGDIRLNGFSGTEDLDVKISGSGDLVIGGTYPDVRNLDVNITGSGIFDGYNIESEFCEARIAGSGDIYVSVSDYLDVRITGSGDLHYKGNPLIDAVITGSGRIIDEN